MKRSTRPFRLPFPALGLAFALAVPEPPAHAQAQQFTLEQVLSGPFPSDLVGWCGGGRVAWSHDDEGKRNVWVAEAPEWKPRRLTPYDADDGQEVTSLAFTTDGRAVV